MPSRVTAAATVATAPLMAEAFDQLSPAALPANVLAAPAVAPAMWLGMLAAIAGQIPLIPVEPINWLDSLCLAYIAQIAHWLAAPRWALLTVHLRSVWSVAAAYAVLLVAMELLLRWMARRNRLGVRSLGRFDRRTRPLCSSPSPRSRCCGRVGGVLRRGLPPPIWSSGCWTSARWDSILLQPPGAQPVLVDTGPPGDGVEDRLHDLGIRSLAAIVISHDQSDHAGDLGELLDSVHVGRGRLWPRGSQVAPGRRRRGR